MTSAPDPITIAIVGCGGMGNRHLLGLVEHARAVAGRDGAPAFRLVAVCDPNDANGNLLADTAASELGERPAVFRDTRALIEGTPRLDAVDITTEPRLHEAIAVEFLGAGAHALVEKPMALTVGGCTAIMRAAGASGRVVCVAENYRFDPLVRLTRALLDAGAIGDPWMLVDARISSGGRIVITPWRHLRLYGGTLLDVGVHNVDLMHHAFGPVATVGATVKLLDRVRTGMRPQGRPGREASPGAIYALTNANLEVPRMVEPDVEDTAFAILGFERGVIGHWTLSHAGHGTGFGRKQYFGSRGSMEPAPPRTGNGPRVWVDGSAEPLAVDALLEMVPDWKVDASTANLFGGERLGGYAFDSMAIDRKIQAAVYADFGRAIATGQAPEVGGAEGRHAVAVVNAMFESSLLGRPVSVAEVEAGLPAVSAWQEALDRDLGVAR